jgi:hypothetical protein
LRKSSVIHTAANVRRRSSSVGYAGKFRNEEVEEDPTEKMDTHVESLQDTEGEEEAAANGIPESNTLLLVPIQIPHDVLEIPDETSVMRHSSYMPEEPTARSPKQIRKSIAYGQRSADASVSVSLAASRVAISSKSHSKRIRSTLETFSELDDEQRKGFSGRRSYNAYDQPRKRSESIDTSRSSFRRGSISVQRRRSSTETGSASFLKMIGSNGSVMESAKHISGKMSRRSSMTRKSGMSVATSRKNSVVSKMNLQVNCS